MSGPAIADLPPAWMSTHPTREIVEKAVRIMMLALDLRSGEGGVISAVSPLGVGRAGRQPFDVVNLDERIAVRHDRVAPALARLLVHYPPHHTAEGAVC